MQYQTFRQVEMYLTKVDVTFLEIMGALFEQGEKMIHDGHDWNCGLLFNGTQRDDINEWINSALPEVVSTTYATTTLTVTE